MTPTARTLAECKRRGWHAQVVERWNQWARKRFDLFGCIDLVAITPDGILGIQTTSGAHHANRMAKAHEEPRITAWVNAGARFEVWSWARRGAASKRKRWVLRTERFE